MRSCSSLVLVQETAEQVTPVHLRWTILSHDPWTGWIWRLWQQRPVRSMPVVVVRIDAQDPIQMPLPDDQQPVQALGTHRANPTFRVGVRVGCLHRRHTTSAPSEPITSSKLRQNFVSRSRSKKRTRRPRSCNTSSRLRACWVTQAPLGLAVTPARWTRRVSSSRKHRTYSRLSRMVSTVKKSQATIPAACWRRNARHVVVVGRGAGSSAWRRRVVRMAVAETRTPSRSSSPWMRW